MLKGYYLTLSALSLMAIGVANAQNYDVKNAASLETQTGFSVLAMQSPIAVDQAERGRTTPLAATAPAVTAESVAAIEPAAGDVAVNPEIEYIVLPEAKVTNKQDVIVTQSVVGNTDTGVEPEEMMKALEKEMN